MRYSIIILIMLNIIVSQDIAPSEAPLNPDYIKYLEKKNTNQLPKSNNLINGYIPHPALINSTVSGSFKKKFYHPATYDLRDYGYVTSVKNQGDCGTCWIFCTFASIESYWKKIGQGEYDLSENHCAYNNGFGSDPCSEGSTRKSTAYLVRGDGPISESDDPYTLGKPMFTPQGIVTQARFLPEDIDVIKQYLTDYGALAASVYYVDDFFSSYNTNNNSFYFGASDNNAGHGITLIGWDDTKITDGGTGAWLAKNSWGTSFGENGYFYISYNDVNVNRWSSCWPGRIAYNSNMTIYYYDKLGWISSVGWSNGPDYALVKFTINGNESLNKIGTYIVSTDATVKFHIYNNFDGTTLSNLLLSTQTFNCDYPGYYSFDLPTPLNLVANQDIFVKIEYTTPNWNYPIPFEAFSEDYADPTIESGMFWISNTGESSTWFANGNDVVDGQRDPCVKLYTMGTSPANTTPNASFTVSPNSGTVNTVFNFNASSCTDTEDATSALQVRWDWNNDGTYDTNYSATKNTTHQYGNPGTYTVKLEVKDSGGLTNTTTRSVTIVETVETTILDERFDTATWPPTGWTQSVANATNTWSLGNVTDNDFSTIDPNNQSSAICMWDANVAQNEWLFSPQFALPNGTASLEFYSGYSTNWLAAATMNLWISTDSGDNWTKIWEAVNDGQPWGWRKQELDLSAYAGNQNVWLAWGYVGQDGDIVGLDVVKLISNGTVGIERGNNKPNSFSLEQNFPNPFNPTTTINFQLPYESQVNIAIYDLMGREIIKLIDKSLLSGQHTIQWNGTDAFGQLVSGGLYFYKLEADDYVDTKKMVFMK